MVLTRVAATNFASWIILVKLGSFLWMAAEILGLSGISALTGLKGGKGVWKISLFSGQEQWKGSCGDKAEISALDLKKILHELMRGKAAEKGRMIPFIPLLLWVQLCHRQKLYSSLVREMQEYIYWCNAVIYQRRQWLNKIWDDLVHLINYSTDW